MRRWKRQDQEKQIKLTLTIGSHLRDGGILHHSCGTSSSTTWHHGTVIGGTGESTTSPHGELLAVHHLLLVRTRTRLHLGVLTRWGAIEWLSCRIAVAIGSRVHGSIVPDEGREQPEEKKQGRLLGDEPD